MKVDFKVQVDSAIPQPLPLKLQYLEVHSCMLAQDRTVSAG